jgi:hypothetical protein
VRQPISENRGKRRPRGFDAGKWIKGRKRHIVTDTWGDLVGRVVHDAGIQDAALCVVASIRSHYRWLTMVMPTMDCGRRYRRMGDGNHQTFRHDIGNADDLSITPA